MSSHQSTSELPARSWSHHSSAPMAPAQPSRRASGLREGRSGAGCPLLPCGRGSPSPAPSRLASPRLGGARPATCPASRGGEWRRAAARRDPCQPGGGEGPGSPHGRRGPPKPVGALHIGTPFPIAAVDAVGCRAAAPARLASVTLLPVLKSKSTFLLRLKLERTVFPPEAFPTPAPVRAARRGGEQCAGTLFSSYSTGGGEEYPAACPREPPHGEALRRCCCYWVEPTRLCHAPRRAKPPSPLGSPGHVGRGRCRSRESWRVYVGAAGGSAAFFCEGAARRG